MTKVLDFIIRNRGPVTVVVAAVVVLLMLSLFTVTETERAIRFRLGEIVDAQYEPGLHMKVPFINNIRKFDARIQTLDTDPERFLTAEKKNVIVDSFVKWRIDDVRRFYTAVAGDMRQGNLRLEQIIKDGLRSEFSKRTVKEVVSGERNQIMEVLATTASAEAAELGIDVVDVRIKRIDLPAEVSNSVYARMRAERERVARDFRSRGAEAAERIRAEADKRREVILAEAFRDGEKIRGDGDATAAATYADAFQQDEDFYAFYRSLQSYRTAFEGRGDILVLEPDSDFFRFFREQHGAVKHP